MSMALRLFERRTDGNMIPSFVEVIFGPARGEGTRARSHKHRAAERAMRWPSPLLRSPSRYSCLLIPRKKEKKMYKTAAALSLLASASAFAPQSGSRVRLLLGQKKRWWIKSFRECKLESSNRFVGGGAQTRPRLAIAARTNMPSKRGKNERWIRIWATFGETAVGRAK